MKVHVRYLLLVVMLACFTITGLTVFGQRQQKSTRPAWEYEVYLVQPSQSGNLNALLSSQGAEGWELVDTHITPEGHGAFFFKRLK